MKQNISRMKIFHENDWFSINFYRLYATVGCHPTQCNEFDEFSEGPEGYLCQLKELIETNKEKVVAIGECGLDNDRINFCDTIVQKK